MPLVRDKLNGNGHAGSQSKYGGAGRCWVDCPHQWTCFERAGRATALLANGAISMLRLQVAGQHWTVRPGKQIPGLTVLLSNVGNIQGVDSAGWTGLHHVGLNGQLALINFLLENGAVVDA